MLPVLNCGRSFAIHLFPFLNNASRLLTVLAMTFFSTGLQAAVPDAGSLQQEQRPQRTLPEQLSSEIPPEPAAPSVTASDLTLHIGHIRFEGYQGLVDEAELQNVVSGEIGRTVTFSELQQLVSRVTSFLRSRDLMLARAYLPEQEVQDGEVLIRIVAGTSDGSVRVRKEAGVRLSDTLLQSISRLGAIDGKPIRKSQLERSLMLLNDLPAVHAQAVIRPGSEPGSSEVTFRVREDDLISLKAWTDNAGNRYTGSWRGTMLLSLEDPFNIGDQIRVLYSGSSHLHQGLVEYRFPVTANGLSGSLSLSGLTYKLGEEFDDLDYRGKSLELHTGLSYPVLLTRSSRTTIEAAYAAGSFVDRQSGDELSDRFASSGFFGLKGAWNDQVLGGGVNSWYIKAMLGDLHESNQYASADAEISGIEGRYVVFRTGASRFQRLVDQLTAAVSWSGQFSTGNLPSHEKFYLGGPAGVRAYPVGEAGGDDAHLYSVDLNYGFSPRILPGSMQIGCFYDAGQVRLNHKRYEHDVVSATGRNSYWLQGAGLQVRWIASGHLAFNASWAHVLGDNPGRSADGTDSDGTTDKNRFWLNAELSL